MLFLLRRMFQTGNFSRLSIIAIGLVSMLLTGCLNVQTNIALYGQGAWNGVTAVQISSEFAQLMEEGDTSTTQSLEGGGTLSTESSFDPEGFEEWLANAQSSANQDDLNVTFNELKGEDGSLNYVLQAEGQEFASLNEVFFEGNADISVELVNGQRQITIQADIENSGQTDGETSEEISAEELEMMNSFGLAVTYRISGGEIISSNATRVEGNTAIWDFPTRIEVTLTEAAEFSPEALTLAAPSPDSGFSTSAFEGIMESVATESIAAESTAEDIDVTNDSSIQTESTVSEQSDSPEVMPEGMMEESVEESTGESLTSPSDASETMTGETPGAGEAESPADIATGVTDSAVAPPAEDSGLPASGAVLPGRMSIAQLVLAGLVLSIMGIGATVSLRQKN